MNNQEKLSFESAIERLETIVKQMEGVNLILQDSMALYEEGVKLTNFCMKELELAQQKIEKLTQTPDGKIKIEPFLEGEE